MATVVLHGKTILTYEYENHREKYWTALSKYIIDRYGDETVEEHEEVQQILLDSFNYLVAMFRDLIHEETTVQFFNHVFFLNEQSWEFLVKTRDGYSFGNIKEVDFSRYRRILKLILEQGCDLDLTWGNQPTPEEILRFENKIQKLFYLGTWIYTFADYIAYHKMVKNSKVIDFNKEAHIAVHWKEPYNFVYDSLFPNLETDYVNAIVEENATEKLRDAINNCFGIDFNLAVSLIIQVKKHFSAELTQTIEPYVLPINLVGNFDISSETANCFYNGISISRNNKMTIEDAILKPYSTERYMYRPILIYKINNVERALVGEGKVAESMYVLATNAISWNTIPTDWKKNKCMVKYMSKKGNEHDSLLEDKIQEILLRLKIPFCRNVKSFKRPGQNNINIDNALAGEIDFIIINSNNQKIYVADSKYNKAKYEAVGYRTDNSNFIDKYEAQLLKKVKWINENKNIVQDHFNMIYIGHQIDLTEYTIEGLFFINTPTFYMFNGKYKALTIDKTEGYLNGTFDFPALKYSRDNHHDIVINHPYFNVY